MKVFDSLDRERQIFIEDVKNDIKIEFYKDDRKLFFTIIEREKDWWEEFKVASTDIQKIFLWDNKTGRYKAN